MSTLQNSISKEILKQYEHDLFANFCSDLNTQRLS